MLEERLNERVKALEVTVEYHDDKISRLEDNTAILSRMEIILENQIEINKEVKGTLREINENLSQLNTTQESMQKEIISMKDEISTTNSRIEKVEKKNEEQDDKGKIDVMDVTKKIFVAVIMAVVGYFLAQIGMKM